VADGQSGQSGMIQLKSAVTSLIWSCHPLPTAAVTLISAGLAALAELSAATAVLVVAAVFTGQLSIGWSNDAIDAARDRRSGRADKPVARGDVSARTVASAAVVATVACVVLSLALGWPAAVASLTVVAAGAAYNFGVKGTWWSALPYAVAFGALPAVATLARPEPTLPATWAMAAGALFGVSAHLANVLPDLEDDVATGVRGLPHRIGARATAVLCPVLLAAASLVILVGSGPLTTWRVAAAALVIALGVAGAAIGFRRPASRAIFVIVVVAVLAAVALFAISGQSLV
jgi:4-hydroxybenzoate polyprenyltransferase